MTEPSDEKSSGIKKFDTKLVTEWKCPEGGGAPIICMPNVPKPLHLLCPRTQLGLSTWNAMRKACYANAGFKCEACGAKVGVDIEKRQLHAHELYDIDYENGTSKFVRCVALCAKCHLGGIHTGRAITLFKQKNPLYPKEFLLDGAENAFKLVHDYNVEHPDADLRVFSTFLEYLKNDELRGPMEELIEKYDIKFYDIDHKKEAEWGDWKLIIGNKEYPTPYPTYQDWEQAMADHAKNDTARMIKVNPFKGPGADAVEDILKNLDKDA